MCSDIEPTDKFRRRTVEGPAELSGWYIGPEGFSLTASSSRDVRTARVHKEQLQALCHSTQEGDLLWLHRVSTRLSSCLSLTLLQSKQDKSDFPIFLSGVERWGHLNCVQDALRVYFTTKLFKTFLYLDKNI